MTCNKIKNSTIEGITSMNLQINESGSATKHFKDNCTLSQESCNGLTRPYIG